MMYEGPAGLMLTDRELQRIAIALVYSNDAEDILIRQRIREYFRNKVTGVTGNPGG